MSIDEPLVRRWLSSAETDLLEFKQEWYDFELKAGKAEFVKDVLALANTTRPGEHGYLVVGVRDKGPDRLLGVEGGPSAEQLAQVLAAWSQPAPAFHLHRVLRDGVRLDVVEVRHEPFRPHYATRDLEPRLRSNAVYVRRGPTIGTLTIPELETMIRAKGDRLNDGSSSHPIQTGFVELPDLRPGLRIVGRVLNVSEDPITIHTTWDVVLAKEPRAIDRTGSVGGRKLLPGESLEDEKDLSRVHFYLDGESIGNQQLISDRWYDVTWSVHFRDRNGFLTPLSHFFRVSS